MRNRRAQKKIFAAQPGLWLHQSVPPSRSRSSPTVFAKHDVRRARADGHALQGGPLLVAKGAATTLGRLAGPHNALDPTLWRLALPGSCEISQACEACPGADHPGRDTASESSVHLSPHGFYSWSTSTQEAADTPPSARDRREYAARKVVVVLTYPGRITHRRHEPARRDHPKRAVHDGLCSDHDGRMHARD